jgi:hypothetical protein
MGLTDIIERLQKHTTTNRLVSVSLKVEHNHVKNAKERKFLKNHYVVRPTGLGIRMQISEIFCNFHCCYAV